MSIISLFQVTNDLSDPRKERNIFKISETEDKTSGMRIGNLSKYRTATTPPLHIKEGSLGRAIHESKDTRNRKAPKKCISV